MPARPTPRQVFQCICEDHAWTLATKGFVVLVGLRDAPLLWERSWCAAVRGRTVYAQSGAGGRRLYLHKAILGGWLRPGEEVDHINRNGLDNRRENLRRCTRAENSRNTRPRTGRFKGIHWSKRDKQWVAQITVGGLCQTVGYSKDEEEAARAYDAAAVRLFGKYAHLNFGGTQ